MNQIAYKIEALKQAFPVATVSRQQVFVPSAEVGTRKPDAAKLIRLINLIQNPTGQDRSADVLRFAGSAARQGWLREEVKNVLLDPSYPISDHCLAQHNPERAADRTIAKAFEGQPDMNSDPVLFAPTPYTWVACDQVPPLPWLMGSWLLREEVTMLVAPGGVGKTTLLTAMALSLVTGRELLGKPINGSPKRVWLLNLEDSVAMMTRSVQATAELHGVTPEQIGDRLFLDTARDGTPLCTARRVNRELKVVEPVRSALVSALTDNKIDVIIVDPFVSSHEGNENDNGEMDRIAKSWCKVAQEAKCAVVLCHHSSKAGSAEVNTNSARGAVALTAAARAVLVLNTMSKTDAQAFGMNADNAWRYFQVTLDKSNRAPIQKADWFEKATVFFSLDNSAAAVRPWALPTGQELLPPEKAFLIAEFLGDQDWRESIQSDDWVGYAIASVLGEDRPEARTDSRGRIKLIVTELLNRRLLVRAQAKIGSKNVPVVRVARITQQLPKA